jgi:hypothetical protein
MQMRNNKAIVANEGEREWHRPDPLTFKCLRHKVPMAQTKL